MADGTTAISPAAFTSFGEFLRYLRRRQRLTQIDLALATGYSTGQISRLEQNQRLPNPDTLNPLFVPALRLDYEPALIARLHELAQQAHMERAEVDAVPETLPTVTPPITIPDKPSQPPHAPLLITKLFVPRSRPNRVVRSRLLARLDEALHSPLTLVSAPAGFGKTTMLANWIAHTMEIGTESKIAWLALDQGDNEPFTFLRYLVAALQTVDASIGSSSSTLDVLQSSQPPPLETLIRVLLNEFAVYPHEIVLVLDDYHLITTPAIHAAMTTLLDHQPPTLHLILATRADPPLPIARLRVRRQMVELRAADLRFTDEEAAAFLRDSMGLSLTADDIAALETRTEGWIAGLQLAALAMRERTDLPSFINAFTGSNRFVVDYLAAEVIERQPTHLQAFLLHTAILDRLYGPLCDAVMGLVPDPHNPHTAFTQSLLEELERANLFLLPLDDERRWYRYHQLFADVLRERLLSGAPSDFVVELHGRAAVWFEEQGLISEAVQQVLATRDWDWAADLIEQHGSTIALRGQVATVLGWLGSLPEAVIRARPRLCVYHAQLLTLANQLEAAEGRLRDAEAYLQAGVHDDQARVIQGLIAAVRAEVVRFSGDFSHGVALARQALALLPQTEVLMRTRVRSLVLLDCFQTGDMTPTTEALATEVVTEARASDNTLTYHGALTDLGWVYLLQGRLHKATELFAQAREVAQATSTRTLSLGVYDLLGVGDVLREWGDLDRAEGYLMEALNLITQPATFNPYGFLVGAIVLARLKQARGDHRGAVAILDQFDELSMRHSVVPAQGEAIAAVRTQIKLAHGDLDAAVQWAAEHGYGIDDELGLPCENEYFSLARVLIAQGRLDPGGLYLSDAHHLLRRLLQHTERDERMGSVIEILVLQALAYQAQGNVPTAWAALTRALGLAAPEGFCRVFVDAGAPMADLLASFYQQPSALQYRPYLARLLAAFGKEASEQAPSANARHAITPQGASRTHDSASLSEREREVLSLVAAGLSNAEIAARLVVGVSTVKKHINNIFGKLAVTSRTQALARARALNLV